MVQIGFYKRAIITGLFFFGIIWINGSKAQNVFTVTKVTDTDPFGYNYVDSLCDANMMGTLQWAVRKAIDNSTSGATIIEFNIPGSGPHVITMNYELPYINKQVNIDGTTQSGYQWHQPQIIIEDTTMTIYSGLWFNNANNCIVKGLYIRKFQGSGIRLNGCNEMIIQDNVINQIGTNRTETAAFSIRLDYSDSNSIFGNIIGTDMTNAHLGNIGSGIGLWTNDYHNSIGGSGSKKNIIAYNKYSGVRILFGDYNLVTRNLIYQYVIPNVTRAIRINEQTIYGNQNKTKPVIDTITDMSIVTGTSEPGDSVELFGSSGIQNANEYLTTVHADANGNWSANLSSSSWPYVAATATDVDNNTSELRTIKVPEGSCTQCVHLRFCFPDMICAGEPITVINGSTGCENRPEFLWNYGDNSEPTEETTHIYNDPGDYTVTLTIPGSGTCHVSMTIHVIDCTQPCINCIGSFSPEPGKKYIVSAWVKEENAAVTKTTYNNPQIYIVFPGLDSSATSLGPYIAKGDIIDGWQRVEEEFDIPTAAAYLRIRLKSVSGNSYFDDIRVYPFDATVKSYVYDPINLRLVSELDERNYATYYEYDEEGKLIRVKKETERGVMTIKESKNSISKK
jgi:hypothetical protein